MKSRDVARQEGRVSFLKMIFENIDSYVHCSVLPLKETERSRLYVDCTNAKSGLFTFVKDVRHVAEAVFS